MTNTADLKITAGLAIRQGLRLRVVYTDGRGHEAVTPVRVVTGDGYPNAGYLIIEARDSRAADRYDTIPLTDIETTDLLYITAMREGQ